MSPTVIILSLALFYIWAIGVIFLLRLSKRTKTPLIDAEVWFFILLWPIFIPVFLARGEV